MQSRSMRKFSIPSCSAMIALEATVRLGSVVRASSELRTSPSAVSRHIRTIEIMLGRKLFKPYGRGIELTSSGEDYYCVVKSALENLHAAGQSDPAGKTNLVIACTQSVSFYVVLPIFSVLRTFLWRCVNFQIVSCDNDFFQLIPSPATDIYFEYSLSRKDSNSVAVLAEEIVPVASPEIMEGFGTILAKDPQTWARVPRLEIAQDYQPWATWNTWFEAHGCAPPEAPIERIGNYQYLLNAAANGGGIALGWNGFVNSDLEAGRLVRIRDGWMRTNVSLYAVLSKAGCQNPYGRKCLDLLARDQT